MTPWDAFFVGFSSGALLGATVVMVMVWHTVRKARR